MTIIKQGKNPTGRIEDTGEIKKFEQHDDDKKQAAFESNEKKIAEQIDWKKNDNKNR